MFYTIAVPRVPLISRVHLHNKKHFAIMDWAKLFPRVMFHQGRTDSNGGHNDWLNRTGWSIGSYHYHHKMPAHLHPNGICPYGNAKAGNIENPYTGKTINVGIAYMYGDNPYYDLDLVGRSLTADDTLGISSSDNDKGSIFHACSTGDSTVSNLGEMFTFTYPSGLLGVLDNKLFETSDGKLQLLAASDGVNLKAYIRLETIREYMMKDGYFTSLSDGGSGAWRFTVRKPDVRIIPIIPQNNDEFHVGDEVTVQANIKHVSSARMIVGKRYPMGYIDGFEERRYNLENQTTVIFSKFKLTEDIIGSAAIESGSLNISVSGHTGGTTIQADIDSHTLADATVIRIGTAEDSGDGDKTPCSNISEFKARYGDLIEKYGQELGVDPNGLGAIFFTESSGGGFYDNGKLKIRFEDHIL